MSPETRETRLFPKLASIFPRKGGCCLKKSIFYVLIVAAGILLGVLAFSSYMLISDQLEHKESRDKDSSASDVYRLPGDPSQAGNGGGGQANSQPAGSPDPRTYDSDVIGQIQLDPEISPLNAMYDLDKFFADYPDAIGWIYCPNSKIDYGVVEAEENDYYLHRFYDGSYSVGGSLFADCCNARDFSDENTVIYGHNMGDKTKFGLLIYYKEQYYYDEHPVMYISTPRMNYRLELFTAFLTDADSDVYTFNFESEEAYGAWLKKVCAESDFKCDVNVTTKDRVVTLSTCSYEYYDARYVVIGKLVPIH